MRTKVALLLLFVSSVWLGCAREIPPAAPPPSVATATAATPPSAPSSVAAPPVSSSASPVPSATNAPRIGKPIALAGGASGYLALPSGGPSKHPALIVIHEYWGMNDWVLGNADRFAGQGYVALALDLYRGHVTTDAGEAHELMRGLPEDRALADMKAAVSALAARPDVDPARIGAIGWCMGGGYALALATADPRLRAVSVNYGRLVTDPQKIAAIHAAVLGSFAGQDRGIPPADVRDFEKALHAAKKDADIKIYDSAGHAFMTPTNVKGYDRAASEDAWSRIDAFFAKELKAP